MEAEGDIRSADVVVDRLGNAHNRQAFLREAQRHPERVLAANRYQSVQFLQLERAINPFQPSRSPVERVRARGAKDGAATRQDPGGARARQLDNVVLEHARPAVAKADEAALPIAQAATHDRSDNGVQPWAVPAACENPYTQRDLYISTLKSPEAVDMMRAYGSPARQAAE